MYGLKWDGFRCVAGRAEFGVAQLAAEPVEVGQVVLRLIGNAGNRRLPLAEHFVADTCRGLGGRLGGGLLSGLTW